MIESFKLAAEAMRHGRKLDVSVYGNFNAAAWGTIPAEVYLLTGTGAQFSNSPATLNAAKTYSFVVHHAISTDGELLYLDEMYMSSEDDPTHADIGRALIRVGPTLASAQTRGWKKSVASGAALTALEALTPAADKMAYYTGAATAALTTLSAFARTLLDDADATTMRATIGAQAADATLTAMAGVTTAADKIIYFTGVDTAAATSLTAFGRSLIAAADAAATLTLIGAQATITGAASTITTANLAVSKAMVTDASGKVAAHATTTATEVGYLAGVNNPIQTQLDGKQASLGFTPEDASKKNVANGYAGLDASGKISGSQLPALAITDTFVVASQAAMLALSTAEVGDVAVRTDVNKSFILRVAGYATLANWQELLTPTDAVLSVNGKTGAVSLVPSDIGAQPVDPTLTAVAGVTTAADTLVYFNGVDTAAATPLTPFARTLLDDTTAAQALATLGAQIADATLTAMAGVTTAADKIIYFTGVDTAAAATLTTLGRTLIAGANAGAMRTTLGVPDEAVSDGKLYARKNGAWVEVPQYSGPVVVQVDAAATYQLPANVDSVYITPKVGYTPGTEYQLVITLPLVTTAKQVTITISHRFAHSAIDNRIGSQLVMRGPLDGGTNQKIFSTDYANAGTDGVLLAYKTVYYAMFYNGAWNITDSEPFPLS